MGNALSLVVSIGVPLAGGIIGGLSSQKDVTTWYQKIKKPRWTPPNFLFGPVWTVLYVSMGTASWFVFKKKGGNKALPLSLYAVQLALNLIWNPLFFKTHKTDVALADITALLGVATAATVTMARAHKPAVQLPLMVPYLVWVSYATALTANICWNNPSERLIKPREQKEEEAAQEEEAKKPAGAIKEAVTAAVTGATAVKRGSEAVSAGRKHPVKAALAADKAFSEGSAAVQHAAAAAQPVVSTVEAVKGVADAVKQTATTAAAPTPAPAAAPAPAPAAAAPSPAPVAAAAAPVAAAVAAEAAKVVKAAQEEAEDEEVADE